MNRLVFALCVVLPLALLAQEAPKTVALPPALTEAQALKVENHLLHVRLAQLEAQVADLTARLQSVTLSGERASLLEELRQALGAPADAVFDWETRTFKPAAAGGDRGATDR